MGEFDESVKDGSEQLAVAKTICRDCIFRGSVLSFLPSQDGKGHWCTIDKLNREKAKFDVPNQYWSLDYFCNSCRNKDWLKAKKLVGEPQEVIQKAIRAENTVKSDLIFLFHQNHLLEDIERVLDRVDATYVSNVLISINNKATRPSHLSRLMNKYKFPWQLNFNLEPICEEVQVAKLHKYTKGMFSIIINRMTLFNSLLPKELDTRINDDGEKFVLYQTEEDGSNLVIHNILFNLIKTTNINDIKQFAEGQKCLHMLKLKK